MNEARRTARMYGERYIVPAEHKRRYMPQVYTKDCDMPATDKRLGRALVLLVLSCTLFIVCFVQDLIY